MKPIGDNNLADVAAAESGIADAPQAGGVGWLPGRAAWVTQANRQRRVRHLADGT